MVAEVGDEDGVRGVRATEYGYLFFKGDVMF